MPFLRKWRSIHVPSNSFCVNNNLNEGPLKEYQIPLVDGHFVPIESLFFSGMDNRNKFHM